MPNPADLFWIYLAAALGLGVILAALAAALVIYQRRFLALHREYSKKLLSAQEEERAWVAREVHDDALQRVAMVVHELHSWNDAPAVDAGRQHLRIDALRQELEDLGVMLRRVAHRLHPALIEQAGLIPALQQLGNDVSRASGLRVDVVVPENGNTPFIPRDQSLIVYRIAQEALRNIVKHASVDRATMQVTVDGKSLTMLINDAGRGFDANAANANARGLGLISMAERARLAEGHFEIQSQPGQGTAVRVTIALRGQSS